jgi:integrase
VTDELLEEIVARVLRERPELIGRAVDKARGTAKPQPLVRDLWAEWGSVAAGTYGAPETVHAAVRMLEVELPAAGGARRLGDWPVDALTRTMPELYRSVRTRMTSGRRDQHGRPATISETTADREMNVMQAMLSWHVDQGRLVKNPIDGWTRAAARRRQTSLTWEQFEEFISHGPPILQDMGTVAFQAAGMRRGEILGLEKSELDHERRELVLRGERIKTDEDRIIPLDAATWAIIEQRAAESRGPFVFVNPRDPKRMKPISVRTFYNWIVRCRKLSGMQGIHGENIVFHLARHGGLNDWLDAGVPPGGVSKAGGVSLATLQKHYLHWSRAQRSLAQERRDARRAPAKETEPHPVRRRGT